MTWHKILPVLLAALGLVVANEPLYDFSSSPIVELTDANFAQLVSKVWATHSAASCLIALLAPGRQPGLPPHASHRTIRRSGW
jgi:hypothetical protein